MFSILMIFPMSVHAALSVELLVRPFTEDKVFEIGGEIREVTLIARANLDGLTFQWDLRGPGTYTLDETARKLYYTLPEHLSVEWEDVTITVTASDERTGSVTEQATFRLHDPSPVSEALTPTPDAQPSVNPETTKLASLLRDADAYFKRTFYTEPETRNAFSLYKQALALDPENQHARQQITAMLKNLRQWTEKALREANNEQGRRYAERYLLIAEYALVELDDQQVLASLKTFQEDLHALQVDIPPNAAILLAALSPAPATPTETADAEADSSQATETPLQRPGDLYAVVIGIETYLDEGIPPAVSAEQEARQFSEVLTDPQYGNLPEDHLMLLLGAEAIDRQIKHAIGVWARERVGADDTLIIYYAGQGAYQAGDHYWVTYDAEPEDLYATALNSDDIRAMFERLSAKQVILLLDCRYFAVNQDGEFGESEEGIPWETFRADNHLIISASEGKTAGTETQQPDLFTSALLEGLQGQADADDDGRMTLEETWAYVSQKAAAAQFQGEMIADFPITFDVAKLQEASKVDQTEARREKLIEIYRQGGISAEQFKKALEVLNNQEKDQILEDFLDGKLSLEIFRDIY